MPKIELTTIIHAKKEIVFDLARSIDLHKISTAHTRETAVNGKINGLIGPDEWVTWRARHLGVVQELTSKITAFQRPDYFVDEMVSGAFKSFRHEHLFSDANGATLMKDIFTYTAPFGVLGRWADLLFLKRYLTRFLMQRNHTLKEYAESDRAALPLSHP